MRWSGREGLRMNHRGRGRQTERDTETAIVGEVGFEINRDRGRDREREMETKQRETK